MKTTCAILLLSTLSALGQAEQALPLFDGKSFKGWKIQKGEEPWWRIEDGAIVGGATDKKIPHNTFITTEERYTNFELVLKVKLEGKDSPNAGIQIRSERVVDHHEMIGYQADVGPGWWGKLYDESRRRKVIGDHLSPEAAKAVKADAWNEYRIRCVGAKIQLFINGVQTVEYEEKDKQIPLEGFIALQAHGGPAFQVRYKDITIKKLPAEDGLPTWEELGEEGKKPW